MTQLRTSLGCAVRLSRPRSSPVTKQLVVFPHAGGGVAFYQHWRELLPDEVDLFIMQYPGREEAQDAPAWETAQYAIARCVDALHASLGIAPAVIFGHSMGALLALQVAAALQTSRFRIDTVLSAQRAPSELKLLQQESQREEVLDHILAFSESSGALTLDALTRPLVTRLIQQDLRLLGELSAEPLPGLQPRIWGGGDDPLVSRSALSQWKKELPGSQVQLLAGDHFYFMQDTAAFLRRLLQ